MEKEKLKKFLERGSDITGGALGAAIGLIGGPAGAIAGGGLGAAIGIAIKDMFNHVLSNRQEVRVAASATFMLTGIQQKLDDNVPIRNDTFFSAHNERSSALELFEGIMIKCKDQFQEKKISYISKIFEKTAFDPTISANTANQILVMSEAFTYRKFCVIAFFGRKHEFYVGSLMKEVYSWYPNANFTVELELLKQDIYELINLGVIDQKNWMVITRAEVIPAVFELTKIGEVIFDILGLDTIPKDDLDPIYEELKYKDEFGVNSQGKRNGA